MSPNLFLILVLACFAGLLLIVLAMRGRRINDHPICRQCRFDLDGVYPEAITCPECGAGLKRDGSVAMGARRRLWPLVVVGALIAITPLVPLGALTVAALTGRDVDKFKPLGLLLWEAKIADSIRTTKIADEILSRILASSLSADQYKSTIEYTLALQKDLNREWSESWGDIIEQASLDGTLTKEQEQQFHANAVTFKLTSRDKARAGDMVPIVVAVDSTRIGSTTSLSVTADVTKLLCGDAQVTLPKAPAQMADPFSRLGNSRVLGTLNRLGLGGAGPNAFISGGLDGISNPLSTTFTVSGSKSRLLAARFGSTPTQLELVLPLPSDISPGKSSLDLTLSLNANSGTGSVFGVAPLVTINGRVQNLNPVPASESQPITISRPIEIVSPDQFAIEPIKPDAATAESIKAKLRPQELVYSMDPFDTPFNDSYPGSSAPVDASVLFDTQSFKEAKTPLAFDVFVKLAGKEYKLGQLTTGDIVGREKPLANFFSSSFTVTINGQTVTSNSSDSVKPGQARVSGKLPTPQSLAQNSDSQSDSNSPTAPTKVDIILRPSHSVASQSLDLSQYIDQEFIFTDVPIDAGALEFFQPQMFPTTRPRRNQRAAPAIPTFPSFPNTPAPKQPRSPQPPTQPSTQPPTQPSDPGR